VADTHSDHDHNTADAGCVGCACSVEREITRADGGRPVGFVRFLLSGRETTIALAAGVALLLSLPLSWVDGADWVATGLHVGVAALAGWPIALSGLRALLRARKVTINLLMSIATVGALLIGETGEAATVIVLFAIGEALEAYTGERARDSLRGLLALAPQEATVLRPCLDCEEHMGQGGYTGGLCPFCGAHETRVPVGEVRVGEAVLAQPGERIPVDGRVVRGESAVNQAPITGESIPVAKRTGDEVFAGTVNGEAALEIEVTRPAADSTLSRIVRLVEQAQAQRSPAERLVDRFARWYTPAVVALAALIALGMPLLLGGPFFDAPDGTRGWLYRGLALLIVSCPCALVISTPVTVASALTGLARRGVLVKGGAHLDSLARARVFAFDKTGTLTLGQPGVILARTLVCPPELLRCEACDDLVALAAAVERRSGHPLAAAVVAEAEARGLAHRYASATSVQALAGQGVQGRVEGRTVTVGSHALFDESYPHPDALCEGARVAENSGQTVMMVGQGEEVRGFIAVADTLRRASREALHALKRIDPAIRTVMLTGDNPAAAEAIAAAVGVDEVRAELLPEDKVDVVRALQAEHGAVAMVGDGINDAPALASATVGVAMGGAGTAQAMETADVVLMQDELGRLPDAVRTGRSARRVIAQNVALSLGIKAAFLVMVLAGLATMWMAVFADMGASLLVTLNGMRLLREPSAPAAEARL
jgi:Cd2+/Zn2+-exporting ATPase